MPADGLGSVVNGHRVDGAQPDNAGRPGPPCLRPSGQVAGLGHHTACVGQHLGGLGSEPGVAAVAFEQGDTDPSLQLGQSLGKCRGGDAEGSSSRGAGGRCGGSHQVLQLLHGEIGEDWIVHRCGFLLETSVFLNDTAQPFLLPYASLHEQPS